MAERALAGAIIAIAITAFARRRGALDESGQWAALACGTATAAAGWAWALMLVAYFVAASALTEHARAAKMALTAGTLPQAAARTATQVIVNGGLYSVLALRAGVDLTGSWGLAALGALASASADTWATEIGIAVGGRPRSILNGSAVAPGISGGVTPAGFGAALAGAAFVAAFGLLFADPARRIHVAAVIGAAGFTGAVADSVAGAAFQARRWCEPCQAWTERRVHSCGYRTTHARGFRWCSNDAVNFAATIAGATTAVALEYLTR